MLPHSYPNSPAESLSNTSTFRSGYVKLPTCSKNNDDAKLETGNVFITFRPSSAGSESKTCISHLLSFLYRFLVGFLRLLCFRLPRNADNESLLNVEYKNEPNGEYQNCRISFDREHSVLAERSLCICTRDFLGAPEHNYVMLLAPEGDAGNRATTTAVAVNKIQASQIRSKVIASKGKHQLSAMKMSVWRSKQQLEQVKHDVLHIRDDIEAAKKLFSEVEKGIQEYKWDAFTRDTWTAFEYRGELCYFPISSKSKYLDPFQQMYSDHRIFIEEMKFHFKWNHGVML